MSDYLIDKSKDTEVKDIQPINGLGIKKITEAITLIPMFRYFKDLS